jgi:hypothetical protein
MTIVKKLSGWMRIWIVLSILFLIGGSIYGLRDRNELYYSYYSLSLSNCKNNISSIQDKQQYSLEYNNCLKESEIKSKEFMEMGTSIPMYMFFYSVLPLIFIWILGFFLQKIYLWIKKGFETKT